MVKLFAVVMGLGLMVGSAWAINVEVSEVPIPGVNAEGLADEVNLGSAGGKVKINPVTGVFTTTLKGTAPNASGAKASFDFAFEVEVEGATAVGDAGAKYSKPKKKTPDSSKATVKAKGIVILPE